MSLWGGRFETPMDPAAWRLNTSLPFDQRLALQDVRGSMAWANALAQAGVLTAEEQGQIVAGLRIIEGEFREGKFVFSETDEDIHSAVERRLTELIGPLGGKLHSGRSRNDQVATTYVYGCWTTSLICVRLCVPFSKPSLSARNRTWRYFSPAIPIGSAPR